MIYLFIAIITSAMIPIMMKHAHRYAIDDAVILTFNYVLATLMSFIFLMRHLSDYHSFFQTGPLLITLILGVFQGLLFYGAFYFYQRSVRENGIAVSIAAGKMGILIPMFLSFVLWHEIPTSLQWVAIVVSLFAIGLISIKPSSIEKVPLNTSLILFFLIGGFGDFSNKLFETTIGSEYADFFLTIVFASALLFSSINTFRHGRITRTGIAFGFMTGLPNMLTALFFILALSHINALVAFPSYSGGAIMISSLYGLIIFKERLSAKNLVGILLILGSLVLINL